jgi:DNA-binding MarR family transcriptional regulator
MKNEIHELFTTMMQIKQAMHSMSSLSPEDRNATMLQHITLSYLATRDNSTMTELAAYLRISLSSATQLVERLARNNSVERVNDENDRRLVHLQITRIGKEELAEMRKTLEEKMGKIFSAIPAQDLKELVRIQKLIVANLPKEIK